MLWNGKNGRVKVTFRNMRLGKTKRTVIFLIVMMLRRGLGTFVGGHLDNFSRSIRRADLDQITLLSGDKPASRRNSCRNNSKNKRNLQKTA